MSGVRWMVRSARRLEGVLDQDTQRCPAHTFLRGTSGEPSVWLSDCVTRGARTTVAVACLSLNREYYRVYSPRQKGAQLVTPKEHSRDRFLTVGAPPLPGYFKRVFVCGGARVRRCVAVNRNISPMICGREFNQLKANVYM